MKKSNAINPLEYLALLCSLNKDKPTCKETLIGRMEEYYEVFVTKRRLRTMLENLIEKGIIVKVYDCYSWPNAVRASVILETLGLYFQAPTPVKGWRRFFNRQKVCQK